MKIDAITLLMLVLVECSKTINVKDLIESGETTAYGYHTKIGIPLANKIREAEEILQQQPEQSTNMILVSRGYAAHLGEVPYQAGILADLTNGRKSACGGSLLSARRVLTAAHCWFDGINQSWRFIVVLGSITLFTDGQRLNTWDIIVHDNWIPRYARNDIAMIKLPSAVKFDHHVAAISLPSGGDIYKDFDGCLATTSGFGATRENGRISPILNQVHLSVISNRRCSLVFPIIHETNICTSGAGGKSSCGGDSGGPLVAWMNSGPILIGITSFGHKKGCEHGYPVVFTRVSCYVDWINKLM